MDDLARLAITVGVIIGILFWSVRVGATVAALIYGGLLLAILSR